MKKMMIVLFVAGVILCQASIFAQADKAGCKDHPLFTRMPDYRILNCKMEDFGAFKFYVVKGAKITVEGRMTAITYTFNKARANEPSGLAIVRNYENAFQKAGGTILQSDPNRWINGKIVKDGQEVWFQVEKGNGVIWLQVVEKKAMEQQIVADASAFASDIRTTGHVAVYGIYFDTGKAAIKPESAQAIGEIARLLKGDAGIKLYVVGHTDNAGSVDGNIKLSQERAEAVVQALVREHGIAPARLRAYGCALFAPIASNDSEEGRAKNRRVELVKQ